MAKIFAKSFRFMGSKEEDDTMNYTTKEVYTETEEQTTTKYTDSEEFKEAHNKEEKTNKSDNIDIVISLLAGYGAFKFARGIAKAFVKSKTPIGVAGVIAFEGAFAIYSAAKALNICDEFRDVYEYTKRTIKERMNDDVCE